MTDGFLIAGVVWVYMTGWFIVSLLRKRNDVADIAWGIGFMVIAWFCWWLRVEEATLKVLVIVGLVCVWGGRLAWHIGIRNRKKAEDERYKKWREEWGKWVVIRSYFQVFMLQGLLMVMVASGVIATVLYGYKTWGLISWLGVGVWVLGFGFEVVGDYQLAQFIKRKKPGEIMTSGLWGYTRHPNYFGEVTLWWGIWLISWGEPRWWLGVIGPLTITGLILGVSGVPMLEKKYEKNLAYQAYKRKVSGFLPLPPKK